MKNLSILLLLILAITISQYFFDLFNLNRPEVPPLLLPAQTIKLSDLGLHTAASGLMWIQTIQDVLAPGTKHYLVLPEYLGVVNSLDPGFSYPYAFGTLILPDLGFIDEAIAIGERGLKEADSDWRIPYYLATAYHIYKHDRVNAIKYFDIASNTEGSPDTVKRVALLYGTSSDIRQQTKQLWISIYETSDDEIITERAKRYIIHYEFIELLEKAAGNFKQKFGSYPDSLDQLVIGRILKEVPKDPFGFEYIIDARGRVSLKIQ